MTTHPDEDDAMRRIADRLALKFPDVAREEIEPLVRSEFLTLAGRPVKNYLSVLTERSVSERLKMRTTREPERLEAAVAGLPSRHPYGDEQGRPA